jgi:hypothetical protein
MAEVPDKQIKRLKALIQEAETSLAAAKELLLSLVGEEPAVASSGKDDEPLGKIIEGVFDGQNMVGSDGKTYPVPANYASKSKLVQGDILKLTISDDGAFMYKQIGPIPRKQVVGTLIQENGHYYVDVMVRNIGFCLQALHTLRQNQGIKSASMCLRTTPMLSGQP